MNNELTLPQNREAERAVLGAILIDNNSIVEAMEILRVEDFYLRSHQTIFRAMTDLAGRREPADLLTVSDLLNAGGELETVGGSAVIAALAEEVPTAANIAHYASIVKRCSNQRQVIAALRESIAEAYTPGAELPTIIGDLTSKLLNLDGGHQKGFHISELLPQVLKEVEAAFHSKGRIAGVPTGLTEFEDSYGGLSRGDLVVVGGRASMGKTGFAVTIAKNTAEFGYPVAIVSAESPAPKILLRLLSQDTGIENVKLQFGILRESDFGKLTASASRLAALPIYILSRVRSWESVKTWLRGIKLKEPNLAMIVIDYAQLLSAPVEERKRHLEVSKISGESKGIALELNAAVLLLSQLNREVEREKNKRPKLADLKESGSLEQDADLVFLLYREWVYDNSANKNLVELNLAKNRDGRIGKMKVRLDPETIRFEDWH